MAKGKKRWLITFVTIVVILTIMALLGNTEKVQWDNAHRENTIKSYNKYLKNFPDGSHASEARSRQIALITDDTPFLFAKNEGTEEALNKFLSDFPGHRRQAIARAAMEDVKAYDLASKEDFYSNYEAYIKRFPNGINVNKAKERLAWLKSHSAIVEIKYPKVVDQTHSPYSNVSSPFWGWSTVFKERSGEIGFKVRGSGYIVDPRGDRWDPTRNEIKVSPGGSGESNYWCSSPEHTLCNGYAIFTWTGEDAGGHPIKIEEKVKLRHRDCPRSSK